jgi:hypothetical protein
MGSSQSQPKPFVHTCLDGIDNDKREQLLRQVYHALTAERYRLIRESLNAYLITDLITLVEEYLGNVIMRLELIVFLYETSLSTFNAANVQAKEYPPELPLSQFITALPCTDYFLQRLFHDSKNLEARFKAVKDLFQASPKEILSHYQEKIYDILVSGLYSLVMKRSRDGQWRFKIAFYSACSLDLKLGSIDFQWKEEEFYSLTLHGYIRDRICEAFKSWNIKAFFEEMEIQDNKDPFYVLHLQWN